LNAKHFFFTGPFTDTFLLSLKHTLGDCVIKCHTLFFAGPPDPPIDVKLVGVTVPNAKTVSVKVSWTPGYSGGFPQQFSIHYRKKGSNGDFIEERVGNPDNNMDTVKGLSPNTDYEFLVQATNERGKSQASAKAQVTTPGK